MSLMSENGPPATDADDESDEIDEMDETDAAETEHLDDVEAGAGCAEIWEHLSERREQAGSD
jgi:hypothetical protein